MSVNKDLSYAFTLSRQCLRFFGVWPDPHIPLNEFRRPNLRYIFAMCLLIFYVFIPQITNIFRVWGNITLMVECIASVNYSSLAFYKLIVTRYHGETLRTLMTSFKADWMTSKRKWQRNTMLKVARTGRSLCFKCYVSLTCATAVFIVFNILKLYRNIHQSQRTLVYQFPYPYDIQKAPLYIITYFIQLLAAVYVAVVNCTVDTFISLLLLHICAQLINLCTTLNEWVENLIEKSILSTDFKKGLTAIVLRHENLIRNAKTIDNCYSAVLLMHMMVATFQLCFESFQVCTIITEKFTNSSLIKMIFLALYANMLLVNLYMYCYSAEKLITELVYQFNYPYGIQKTPVYVITYFTQMSAALYGAAINSTVDTFIALLLLHICAQLINLRITLNEWVENLTEKSILSTDFKKGLSAIVLRHEDLIRNAKTIDDCYSTVLLMHIVIATFQLCFESFQVYTLINLRVTLNKQVKKLTDKSISSAIFKKDLVAIIVQHENLIRSAETIDDCYSTVLLVYMIAITFQLCFESFQLYASTSMAHGVYECKWYDLPPKDAKDLMFIVYRSRIPLRLTAGKFGTFSLEMFGTTVKTSMGYLSVLLTMSN
ncbi:uncharacterized protein LOC116853541 [Odontomachus brunneus]|uniref:uncharacterized protein LOC116853541 n=1 Tax=Odontomachus brunneus TaxID=486640 RepID=UPI0013F20A6F|nr:uncharacterized protein LOC116853541 [Odontomachus brunneus]